MADNRLRDFLAEKFGPKAATAPATTDFVRAGGENPRLSAFLAERLHPSGAGSAEAATVAEPPPNATDDEMRAWAILNDDQRQAVTRGDPDVTEHFQSLVAIYAGEA